MLDRCKILSQLTIENYEENIIYVTNLNIIGIRLYDDDDDDNDIYIANIIRAPIVGPH